ncbi:hypothetical protein MRB53_000617 [Persea americana]|uniref:Uncharacterized protein n=1 Tax=Persea americana TaxID=3435 RepID=A0ACC2MQD6_PERAE|nr:hypothetical protein MRB53_000617 [Persea americana]|eukprot:TRINITY_DN62981_c0_g1_i1.p1 TRINITY_DN62981_c0_g1~~TRINITY_DN62981_c0_g1_i1.p1  ORF type:complete len:262 (+),score=48.34 TRINITY_DN62981_c0_g1_i1:61-846(+)
MSTPPPYFSDVHTEDPNMYHYNSRTLVVAVAALLSVISLVLLLHVYAKWWFLRHSSSRRLSSFVSDLPSHSQIQHLSIDLERDADTGLGLDASVVAALPMFGYKSDEHKGTEECVICLSVLVDEEKARILPKCRHVFHVGCIDMWLHSHSTCPICRAFVVPGEEAMDVSSIVTLELSHDPPPETSSSHEQAVMTEEHSEIVVEVEIPPDLESQTQKDSSSGSLSLSSSSSSSSYLGCSLKRMLSWNRSESKVFPSTDGNGN